MSVQEKREHIIESMKYLNASEIDLLQAFLLALKKDNESLESTQKLFEEVQAKYGNVLAKLAQ